MMLYQFVLALHIIAVISWMAGILYLFRLFVYHAEESEAVVKSRFVTMETKLFNIIVMPASTVALLLGIAMLVMRPEPLSQGWMHAKLLFVIILLGITHGSRRFQRKLAMDQNTHSGKFFRILNEVPTVLMILIVLLVIMRPF